MTSETAAAEMLREHFPDASESKIEWHAFFLGTSFATANLVGAIDRKAAIRRIESVEAMARRLSAEYQALPLVVKPRKSDLSMRLSRVLDDLQAATDQMRRNAEAAFPMHHNQRDAEFPAKVQLVQTARECWEDLSGETLPRYPGEAHPFRAFVEALIELHGREWGVDNTLRAWRTRTSVDG